MRYVLNLLTVALLDRLNGLRGRLSPDVFLFFISRAVLSRDYTTLKRRKIYRMVSSESNNWNSIL